MTRVLIAGIGNIFLGDDAFGVRVVEKLTSRAWPKGVAIADFGIRGHDLAYALTEGWDRAILIDAVHRGGAPGTLYLLEPEVGARSLEGHSLGPEQVLALARSLGALPPIRIVGCEPASFEEPELSSMVAAAIDPAIAMIEELLDA